MTRSNDFLLSDARDAFDVWQSHHERTAFEARLPLSRIWSGDIQTLKRGWLTNAQSAADAVDRLQAHLFQGTPPLEEAGLAVDWHLSLLRNQGVDFFALPESMQESSFAPDSAIVSRGDRRLRPDFFRHFGTMRRVERAFAREGFAPSVVAELGPGAGNLARLLCARFPIRQYVLIDLPDTLAFSYMYLRLNFPDRTFFAVGRDGDVTSPAFAAANFCLVPVSMADEAFGRSLKPDLFVNTASLGETTRDSVRHWFRLVQTELAPRYFLSVNRFLNTIDPDIHAWRIHENGTALEWGMNWEMLDWELEPDFLRCPWVNKHARQLLVLAKRSPFSPKMGIEGRALFDGACRGSWRDRPLSMTCQDGPIGIDLSMTGILFALWESYRLAPAADTLAALIEYLREIAPRGRRHFEEYHQYRRAFAELFRDSGVLLPSFEKPEFDFAPRIPHLIKNVGRHNIVAFESVIYTIDQSIGALDLRAVDPLSMTGVKAYSSIAEAELALGVPRPS